MTPTPFPVTEIERQRFEILWEQHFKEKQGVVSLHALVLEAFAIGRREGWNGAMSVFDA